MRFVLLSLQLRATWVRSSVVSASCAYSWAVSVYCATLASPWVRLANELYGRKTGPRSSPELSSGFVCISISIFRQFCKAELLKRPCFPKYHSLPGDSKIFKNPSLLGQTLQKWASDVRWTNRGHFWGSGGPAEFNGGNEKARNWRSGPVFDQHNLQNST